MKSSLSPDKRQVVRRTVETAIAVLAALFVVGLSAELLQGWAVHYYQ